MRRGLRDQEGPPGPPSMYGGIHGSPVVPLLLVVAPADPLLASRRSKSGSGRQGLRTGDLKGLKIAGSNADIEETPFLPGT
jgi:hypothetical protein